MILILHRLASLALIFVATVIACDPSMVVTFENATGEQVRLYHDESSHATPITTLEAGETKRVVVGEDFWTGRLIARNAADAIIFDARITWDELKALEKLTIR